MDSARWAKQKELFTLAIAYPHEEALRVLQQACGGDTSLFGAVAKLIWEHFRLEDTDKIAYSPNVNFGEQMVHPGTSIGPFHVLHKIGAGTFGDVYCVYDENRAQIVALKILREDDSAAIFYFKREFRSLAGVRHRNLVELYELIGDGTRWKFSMEYVKGVDFLEFTRRRESEMPSAWEQRLRSALWQLAEALKALHCRGLLHRDLKPSNVLVTEEGRVVLLDFGLVRNVAEQSDQSLTLAGTPDYMSPEQSEGKVLSEASDWYSFAVILYRALTGSLPFSGNYAELPRRKRSEIPPSIQERAPHVPADLSECCMGLLHPDPEKRLVYVERLCLREHEPITPNVRFVQPILVGRDDELRQLNKAYQATLDGKPVAVHVRGPSGIGKSVLVWEFLNQLKSQDNSVLILSGRCYERESVPYSGLDDVIDSLSQHLRRLSSASLEQVLPRHFGLLTRMFPVLSQVRAVERRVVHPPDSTELRSRAFAALRELFGRVAERRPLVLVLDDLQWGDLDGCEFLQQLMYSLDAPPLLAVMAYRSEDCEINPALSMLSAPEIRSGYAETVTVRLGYLPSEASRELAHSLVAGRNFQPVVIEDILEQSHGDPFLICELANGRPEHLLSGGTRPSIDHLIKNRIQDLNEDARHVLELVAMAGQPTQVSVLNTELGPTAVAEALDRLLPEKVLRSRVVLGRTEVEVYHDRIRSVVLNLVDAETRQRRHAELARALESEEYVDSERIAIHYHHAGEAAKAHSFALLAAEKASEALTFNKAVEFYNLAMADESRSGKDRSNIYKKLGDVLSAAGRGPDAATAYLRAAAEAAERERLLLKAHAAGQLLRSGHIERGTELLNDVLRQAHFRSPTGKFPSLVWLAWLWIRVRMRGTRFRERHEIAPAELRRLDLCWTAAVGLTIIDPFRYSGFVARYFLLAQRSGEPYRFVLALAAAAPHSTFLPKIVRCGAPKSLLEQAGQLAGNLKNPHATAFVRVMRGITAYFEGDWKAAVGESEAAAEMLRSQCTGVTWELGLASIISFLGHAFLGEFTENRKRLAPLTREAESRGDLFTVVGVRLLGCAYFFDAAADRPEKALEDVKHALSLWPHKRYDLHQSTGFRARVDIYLYSGQPEKAWNEIQGEWPELLQSDLLRLPPTRAFSYYYRGKAALAMALCKSGAARESFLEIAGHAAKSILSKGPQWSTGLALLLLSGIESFSVSRLSVAGTLTEAQARLKKANLVPFYMAVSYHSAQFDRGDAVLQTEVDEWVAREGIVNAERMFCALAPGAWSKKSLSH